MPQELWRLYRKALHTVVNGLSQQSADIVDTDRTVADRLVELCRRSAAEGLVLLRNEGGVLPLPAGAEVAVFGRVQCDWFAVGYGSGGDVKPPYSVSLLGALREVGVAVSGELAAAYEAWSAANPPDEGYWGNWPRHFEEMPLDPGLVSRVANTAEVAVVLIGRAAGEDRENVLEKGSYYLTDAERAMLDAVVARFERVVAVVNTGNVMDLSWVEEYGDRLAGLILAWQGGMEGSRAVADVLTGAVSPSGRLTDSIARRYEDYPTAGNFGAKDYNFYAEDVFVGYRYFETFARDAVQFPFGFGLSYATFGFSGAELASDDEVRVAVEITNTGSRAGREVVQLYVQAPDGALGKPARALVGYAKTRELAPGESERVQLTVPVDGLASYDDGGATGHRSAWVLEPGAYRFFLGADVRSAVEVGEFTVPELRVVEQLAEACAVDPAAAFRRMTVFRAGDVTRPGWEDVPVRTVDLQSRIAEQLPVEVPVTGDRGIALGDVAAGRQSMEEFVAQLSDEELEALTRGHGRMNSALGAAGNAGVFGGILETLRANGVPPTTCTDGPSGIRLSAYASLLPCGTALASTWDPELVRELAAEHGREMVRKGSDVLLSPGMNIHRDPLCGRNFEYFSEDPLVTGRMGAAVVAGVQSQGVAACPKHFAANNQETNRSRHDSRVSERALREIYLKGFEICVKEARPQTIMTSYNKINGVWAHYNYELITTILREQWGYQGMVMTDWWMQHS
ncbi:MAG TPA: glycoside hydrolase family 3 N-terminal domain-containing protein, partial [Arachnia sp.]|nr:glycoside hydrolase family 3 N-terminal domain-containing protein [Arachnia sp.]